METRHLYLSSATKFRPTNVSKGLQMNHQDQNWKAGEKAKIANINKINI